MPYTSILFLNIFCLQCLITFICRFKVTCLEAWGEGIYPIKIFPSSYWEPLKLTNNKALVVEESTSLNITSDILEVSSP